MELFDTIKRISPYKVLWYAIAVADGISTLWYISALDSELYNFNTFWVGVGFTLLLLLSLLFVFLFVARKWDNSKEKIQRNMYLTKRVFVTVFLLDWIAYLIVTFFQLGEIQLISILPEFFVVLIWVIEISVVEIILISSAGEGKANRSSIWLWLGSLIIFIWIYLDIA